MGDESEGSVETEKLLLESAEADKEQKETNFQHLLDVDDAKRELKEVGKDLGDIKNLESTIRSELEHAQELANDPTNWEMNEVTGRLCTIDIYLGMKDLVRQYDPRSIAIAKTHVQNAIMWLNRAFYQEKIVKKEAKKGLDDEDKTE